jgi:hypothetical protein
MFGRSLQLMLRLYTNYCGYYLRDNTTKNARISGRS